MKNAREEMIEQLKSHYDSLGKGSPNRTGVLFSMSKEQLKDLIDMLSDSGRGRWIADEEIDVDDDGRFAVYCSKCGERNGYDKTNFCPNCGADMRK